MTKFSPKPSQSLDAGHRKKEHNKRASTQKRTSAAKEAPDDEEPVLPCKPAEENTSSTATTMMLNVKNASATIAEEGKVQGELVNEKRCKENKATTKSGEENKEGGTNNNSNNNKSKNSDVNEKKGMLLLSSSSSQAKKGKEKLRPKAKLNKTEHRGGGKGNVKTGKDKGDRNGKNAKKKKNNNNNNNNKNNVLPQEQSAEVKQAPLLMHLVTHDISEMQMDKAKASTTSLVPSQYTAARSDHSWSNTSPLASGSRSSKSDYRQEMTGNNDEDPPEKSLSLRYYSVMPPLTIPREGRKGHMPEKSAVANTSGPFTSRARSAPSVVSVNSFDEPTCTDHSGSKTSHKRSPHLSIEDALDGLVPKNFLYPTRQLLTPSLASPEEKERTATIVFDLDETLCNNRRHGPAILRPGAVEILRKLRDLYPHPVLHQGEASTQSTSAATTANNVSLAGGGRGGTSSTAESKTITGPSADGVMLRLEIIIWTASVEVVARPVIARLDPDGSIVDHVIYRDVRWYREGGYTKDLRRIGRHLERNIIVENAPSVICMNRRNAILVNDFVNNPSDRQLFIVRAILQEWLYHVNNFLIHRHLRHLEQRRHHMVQEGGESPEPDQLLIAPQTRCGSVQSSISRSRGDVSFASSSAAVGGRSGSFMHELEMNASAIHFLTHHPLLSPGTRYVKPSAWRKAMKILNASGNNNNNATNTADATITNRAATAGGASAATATSGGSRSCKAAYVCVRIDGGKCLHDVAAAATTTGTTTSAARPVVIAKPRGHRSFVDMARGPREGRQ